MYISKADCDRGTLLGSKINLQQMLNLLNMLVSGKHVVLHPNDLSLNPLRGHKAQFGFHYIREILRLWVVM